MQVTFNFKGMTLDADIDVTPFIPAYMGGHPDNWCPEEGGDIDIKSLSCGGMDASFLLKFNFCYEIEMEALEAGIKQCEQYIYMEQEP